MAAIAAADAVFLQKICDLSADLTVPNRGEVQKNKDLLLRVLARFEGHSSIQADLKARYLSVADLRKIHVADGLLLFLLQEPPARAANDKVLHHVRIII